MPEYMLLLYDDPAEWPPTARTPRPRKSSAATYTIVADSYAEAIERCRDHPHFEYGGTIEVREIEKL